jgi:hypothetical protein
METAASRFALLAMTAAFLFFVSPCFLFLAFLAFLAS